ncbi:TrkH family potassium uptake protein [Hoeflea sp. YIM 152468]|uniref:TrkH family potassium uptake protein n=1 Tax=Hoeflea sp. YIM 152468 TaxID=3031759 RepID=UPI0023DB779D|nr:TrkH family potassium uptake protein [Hoeflea sp. YIM 152468]MDF1608766.1 TrkH family potassium uptake protein [Hoeflea sp. YIM 152468]
MNALSDLRPVLLVTGLLVATLGAAMLLPALVDLAAANDDWMIFTSASMMTMLVGLGLFAANRGAPKGLSTRQAMLMTVVSWVALVGFGALPFHWSGIVPSYTDAFFESMSGLTTTGATVITGLDNVPPGLLFWRGLLQWLGGLGIIVMAIAVLPMLQIGGMQLFKAEAFDTAEKILPRAAQISTSITLVFIGMTGICAVAYMAVGMAADDAVVHAMTTVATGGFSTKDASIGYFNNPAVEWIAVVFMILGSIPFILYVQMLQGRFRPVFRDEQVKAFLSFLGAAILAGWVMAHFSENHVGLEALRHSAFNVVSIATGTGYASTDYGLWGPHAVAFFFIIMFVGGCAGSTSCGIKIFRFQVLLEAVRQHISQVMYPNGVFRTHFNGKPIQDRVVASVMSFFFLFMAAFVVLSILLRLTGLDTLSALSGAGTALSNVGPGLGEIIGPSGNFQPLSDVQKWLLSAGMLLGRLELFTVLVLFLPRFWRS